MPIVQPVLDGLVRDFSDWSEAISQSSFLRDASSENNPTISTTEPATVVIQSAQHPSVQADRANLFLDGAC